MPLCPYKKVTNTIAQNTITSPNNTVTYTIIKPYENDTVEISQLPVKQDKKKKHRFRNFLIGLGATCTAFIAMGVAVHSRKGKKIAQLYKDKLVISNLPEKIDFNEAKTLEEAYKFTKDVLKIKDVDKDFTLDALNIINRGLVNVSNAHKGKVFMPRALHFRIPPKDNEGFIACVYRNINSEMFGNMCINKDYFSHDVLNKHIDRFLYFNNGHKQLVYDSYDGKFRSYINAGEGVAKPTKELEKYIKQYYKDPSKMSIKEKQELYYSLRINKEDADAVIRNPMNTIQNLVKEHRELLDKEHFEVDFELLSKKSVEEQKDKLHELISLLIRNGKANKEYTFDIIYPSNTTHHEMGHLQDYALNLKNLNMKRWLSIVERDKIFGFDKNGKRVDRSKVDELQNRWGSIHGKEMKEYFEKYPDAFKTYYPDLYEFLTNRETQITAGKVSAYAQTGIGEFIAETYAQMIRGKEIPEDVMRLYKKYNGPIPDKIG